MIISEYQLRSIIKNMLLENFLDSKVDSLEAVEISGLKYQAYGYITQKGKKCAMIMVKKKNHQKMMDIGAILLKAGAKYTIENNGKKFGQVAHKNNKNAYYAVPVDTKGIKFSSVKLETGAASMADWAVEIGGILGGIPFIGEPIDIAAGIVAAIKRPPDYLLAACSILFALPAIGTAIAIAGKPLIKKFGKEGAETVGKEIGKAMAKSGKEIGSETIELAAKKGDELFDALLSDDTVNQACSLLNESRLLEASCALSVNPWREAMENVRKEFDEVMEGIRKAEKESLDNLKKSGDDASKAAEDEIKNLEKAADTAKKDVDGSLLAKKLDLAEEKAATMAKLFDDGGLNKQYTEFKKAFDETREVAKKMKEAKTIKPGSKNYTRLATEMAEIGQPYMKIMEEIKIAQKEISERLAKATEANDIAAIQREKDLLGIFEGHAADNVVSMLKAQNDWIKKSIDKTGEVVDVHEIMIKSQNEMHAQQISMATQFVEFSKNMIDAGFTRQIQKELRYANYDIASIQRNLDWDIRHVKSKIKRNKGTFEFYAEQIKRDSDFIISRIQKQKEDVINRFIKEEEVYLKQLKSGQESIDAYKKHYQEMIEKYGKERMKKPVESIFGGGPRPMPTPKEFEKVMKNVTNDDYIKKTDPITRANIHIRTANIGTERVQDAFKSAERMFDLELR